MARPTVAYWPHVGTGEVCAVRVDDDGAIVSARGNVLGCGDVSDYAAAYQEPSLNRRSRIGAVAVRDATVVGEGGRVTEQAVQRE